MWREHCKDQATQAWALASPHCTIKQSSELTVTPVLQMGKLGLKENKQPAQDHKALELQSPAAELVHSNSRTNTLTTFQKHQLHLRKTGFWAITCYFPQEMYLFGPVLSITRRSEKCFPY